MQPGSKIHNTRRSHAVFISEGISGELGYIDNMHQRSPRQVSGGQNKFLINDGCHSQYFCVADYHRAVRITC